MIFLLNLKSIWIKCLDCKKCGVCRRMDYYLNEYSLRGQFKDTDEFMETLRTSTLPVLDRIKAENESILWKKDTFWNLEICNGIIISKIKKKKNERSPELIVLKNKLIQLCTEKPFWESEQESQTDVIKYDFDNAYCELFENPNCFLKAIENEGKIVSFIHEEYKRPQLPLVIRKEEKEITCSLDNIFDSTYWRRVPEIKTWKLSETFTIEVRAKEYDYHPPHFHVTGKDRGCAAVFRLEDGELYKKDKNKWTSQMTTEVQKWYKNNKEELSNAWNTLHSEEFSEHLLHF